MFLSLLYPDRESAERALKKDAVPDISSAVCEELGLSRLLPLQGSRLSDCFTRDPEVIAYRQELFSDLLECPALGEVLSEAIPLLFDILSITRRRRTPLPRRRGRLQRPR